MTPGPLSGRKCLITGASSGLGAAIARAFWQGGASLAIAGRNRQALEQLAQELTTTAATGQQVAAIVADLDTPDGASAMADQAQAKLGGVTVVVNNAGTQGPIGPLWENDPRQWEQTIRVNLMAPVAVCFRLIPAMIQGRYGKIINLSGGGGASSRPRFSAYAASKSALVRLTEVLADETRGMGIDVNAIAPGAMNTRMLDQVLAAGPQAAGQREYDRAVKQAASGGTSPAQAAELAVFLASAASDGITGRLISAVWDPWRQLPRLWKEMEPTDIYQLRRIVPKDRGKDWVPE